MKTFLLLSTVLFSTFSFSQTVRPNVYAFGNRIQVQVTNYTNDDVRCSGFVYGRLMNGRTDSHYYSEVIYKGRSSYRNLYSRDFRARYTSAYQNIFCSKF